MLPLIFYYIIAYIIKHVINMIWKLLTAEGRRLYGRSDVESRRTGAPGSKRRKCDKNTACKVSVTNDHQTDIPGT